MKTYNAALQAQLDAYLSEQSGLPQSKAAAMIGVSPTALSQYRNSKYPGDVEAVESKIEEFLRTRSAAAQAEAEKAPYLSAGYVPTSVSEDVYKAIQYCQLERGIVVLHGDAGIGKTRGAARVCAGQPCHALHPLHPGGRHADRHAAAAWHGPETARHPQPVGAEYGHP